MKKNTIRFISPDQLHEKMRSNSDLVIIDTMTKEHYDAVHIPDAVNYCVHELYFLKNIECDIPDKSVEIVVYGATKNTMEGIMSAEKLIDAEYKNVSILEGGIELYQGLNYELQGSNTGIGLECVRYINDGRYNLDIENSALKWTGRNANLSHSGSVKFKNGKIKIKDSKVKGHFHMDMETISISGGGEAEKENLLVSHLLSDDFLLTRIFPIATFEIESVRNANNSKCLSAGNYTVKGILEMRGIRAEIEFSANIALSENGKICAEAHLDIDRTRWGIIYGSCRFFRCLGKYLVYDPVSVDIRLVTL